MTSLVFLHGFLGSPAEWHPTLDTLSVTLPKTSLVLPLGDDWTHGLWKVIDELPAQVVLVGYSLGARVALGVALAIPERLQGLCLVSVNPGLEPADRQRRQDRDADIAQRVLSDPWPEFLDDWYRQEVFASLNDATRAAWIAEKLSMDRPYQADLLRCYSIADQPNYWPRLAELHLPTLIVAGELDRKYVAIARRMQQQAPQLKLHIVASAGHAIHREQPGTLQRILSGFVGSLMVENTNNEQPGLEDREILYRYPL